MSEINEKQYYTNGNVTVTNKRLIVQSQTFAVSGITSVKVGEDKPSRIMPILLLVIGILISAASLKNEGFHAFPIGMVVVGIVWLALQKTMYTVLLTTASGESKAVTSQYKDFVESVVSALNQAIVER